MIAASWTDIFFLSLLCIGTLWMGWSLRCVPTRQAFRSLYHQPWAVGAGMVLLVFFGLAVMDCIHLNEPDHLGEYRTVLDHCLAPLDDIQERTFSMPLSLRAYMSEVQVNHGQYTSTYPALLYPAEALPTAQARDAFIMHTIWIACCSGVLAAMGAWGLGELVARKRYQRSMQQVNQAFRTAWIMLGLLVALIVLSYGLSRHLHVLGTGKIGQDIFYYAVKSIRTGLVIGVLTTLFTLPFALLLGVAAGYFGGWVDDLIQYLYTTLSSIPGVLLITASVLSMQTLIANHPAWFQTLSQQADARLLALCLILGVTSWTSLCRLLRAEAMRLKQIDYVLAAKVLGASSFQILRRHLLPNVMHVVVITLVLDFSYLILAEALLTYVGVGVAPMTMSWGNMINSARLELAREPIVWWPVCAAFGLMFTVVLASNIFADAVEAAWNPRSRT